MLNRSLYIPPPVPIRGYSGEWGGGRHAGGITKRGDRIVFRARKNGIVTEVPFLISDHGSEDAARQAAVVEQARVSVALNATKNRHRFLFDDSRQQYYLEVNLTQNKTMAVCLCHNYIECHPWHAQHDAGSGDFYAMATVGRTARAYHRMVAEALTTEQFKETDHIDGDTLNNRCHNIAPGTQSQNARNRRLKVTNTSGRTGVYHTHTNSWKAMCPGQSKSFPVKKYGEVGAFNMASLYRTVMEIELGITVRPPKRRREDDDDGKEPPAKKRKP